MLTSMPASRSLSVVWASVLSFLGSDTATAPRIGYEPSIQHTGCNPAIINVTSYTDDDIAQMTPALGVIAFGVESGELVTALKDSSQGYVVKSMNERPCLVVEGGWSETFANGATTTAEIQGGVVSADQFVQNYTAAGGSVSEVELAAGEHGIFLVVSHLAVDGITYDAGETIRVQLYDSTATATLAETKVRGGVTNLCAMIFKTAGSAMHLQLKVTHSSASDVDLAAWRFAIFRVGNIAGANALTSDSAVSLPAPLDGP